MLDTVFYYVNKFISWLLPPEEETQYSMPSKDEVLADIMSSEEKLDAFVDDCMSCLRKQKEQEYLDEFMYD